MNDVPPSGGLVRLPLDESLARAQEAAGSLIRARLRGEPGPVAAAMRYACEGGKGLRAFLVLEGARLHDVPPEDAGPLAAAIEALHAYSLIHDDLPCMDDDDLRRGRPTVHRKWDEATAVLAGDGLQALAYELVHKARGSAEARLRLVTTLADMAGISGMVGGQADDIAAETAIRPATLDTINAIQSRKTGALIIWSATAGPILTGADESPLRAYGLFLGQAFQIADDLLDVEGDAATVGKAVAKDAARGKATFVSLLGLDAARARANSLVQDACDALAPYGAEADTLREAARFVTARRK